MAMLAGAVPGLALGAASAAVGAAITKLWCDQEDAQVRCLGQVQKHTALRAAPEVDLCTAARTLLLSFDWCLSWEDDDEPKGSLSGHPVDTDEGTVGTPPGKRRSLNQEYRRHFRRIWRICAQPPPPHIVGSERSRRGSAHSRWRGVSSSSTLQQQHSVMDADKVFGQAPGQSGARGVCAALCFLVSSFLEFRRGARGRFRDAERSSLRLATAALARHPALADVQALDEWQSSPAGASGGAGEDLQFRHWAMALICFLDAALSWGPLDPLGWVGRCQGGEDALTVHYTGFCTFRAVAGKLRLRLRKALSGCRATWRRLAVQLDAVRERKLPEPWPWIWVRSPDAEMLVRNHSKVRLRVELHRPPGAIPSVWADWPLLRRALQPQALLTADVGPGVEWVFRPQAPEDSFRVRVMSRAGIEVCSRGLRRGQAMDFRVSVPPRPDPRAVGLGPLALETRPCSKGPRSSVGSTAAPSELSTLASIEGSDAPELAAPERTEAKPLQGGGLSAAICPQCLRQMAARSTPPASGIYEEGARCDSCQAVVPTCDVAGREQPFFHCELCWYDLCYSCAVHEMLTVWWGGE